MTAEPFQYSETQKSLATVRNHNSKSIFYITAKPLLHSESLKSLTTVLYNFSQEYPVHDCWTISILRNSASLAAIRNLNSRCILYMPAEPF
jgi:hypothetical protein